MFRRVPTVLRVGSFRFHFYSDERGEPPHIHVRTPDGECKFWLTTLHLARNDGVRATDLRAIKRLTFQHRRFLLEKYDEHHDKH